MLALFNPFYGKIGRLQWWLSQLAVFGLGFLGLIVTIFLFADFDAEAQTRSGTENLGIAVSIMLVIYTNFSTCMNRLRDSGRSGFWYLSFLLPTVGSGLMLYFCGIEKGPGRLTSDRSVSPASLPMPTPPPEIERRSSYQPTQRRTFGRRTA